ncbi:unnamed protein product [Ceratitis capitata]|uniref:(Mediterranean fruit fly) hypothetical protein n=1 Tax=Ceratitis capitata TaxID=7213 RepID=A0A811VIA6_CERCA|nr:unnamed protein product [Ceratitis capitata]
MSTKYTLKSHSLPSHSAITTAQCPPVHLWKGGFAENYAVHASAQKGVATNLRLMPWLSRR